jgi:hypothetical protein
MQLGDRAKGFKFENGTDGVRFYDEKEMFIGKIGIINSIQNNSFIIVFPNDRYMTYPLSLIHLSKPN